MLKKIKLISNNISYGPCPDFNDEVEQHLTITDTGRVWFSRYIFGAGKHLLKEKMQIAIDGDVAKNILSMVEAYTDEGIETFATDVGMWKMTLTDINGNTENYSGSLVGEVYGNGIDITEYIREHLPLEYIFAFDEC